MRETPARLVPSFSLDLADLPAPERDEAWRRAFVHSYDMPDTPPLTEARGRAFSLGKAVLADTAHPAIVLARDPGRARRDGADNIMISTQLEGGFQLSIDDGEESVGVGRVTLFDVARPVIKRAEPGRVLVLAVARELVEEVLPGRDVHGFTLDDSGALLAEHLRSLLAHLPSTAQVATPHLLRSTLQLLAACVLPTAERMERARPALHSALLGRAKRYIRVHCRDPAISPATVAAGIGASRAGLYRAFESMGGVAEHIRRARLNAARAALVDPGDTRRIGEIAYASGFTNEAQFSRAIRAEFGVTPSELRLGQGGLYVGAGRGRWVLKRWGEAAPEASDDASVVAIPPWLDALGRREGRGSPGAVRG